MVTDFNLQINRQKLSMGFFGYSSSNKGAETLLKCLSVSLFPLTLRKPQLEQSSYILKWKLNHETR